MLTWLPLFVALLAWNECQVIASPPSNSRNAKAWHGWASVKYLFVFGDSYTTVGFNVSGIQPTAGNPLGNPPYPGYTSSNGPNWVDFLTITYNKSIIRTYDLAYGGATIDSNLIVPYEPTVISMKEQVLSEYIPIYSSKPNFAPWSASNSLFSFFIGINDVGNTYPEYAAGNRSRFDTDWIEYARLVDRVYQTGARNFLFLNVPPVDKSPLTKDAGTTAVHQEATEIKAWNERLLAMASNFTTTYSDASAFVFDTNRVFDKILANPRSFVQTRDLKNLTDYCVDYENGTTAENTFVAECIYPVNEYFWLNSLHPTYSVHNATALELSKMLSSTD